MKEEKTVQTWTCAFCGKIMPSVKKYITMRRYCSDRCRSHYWAEKVKESRSGVLPAEMRSKKVVKKYDPKEAEASWARIVAKRDPITHRYYNGPAKPGPVVESQAVEPADMELHYD